MKIKCSLVFLEKLLQILHILSDATNVTKLRHMQPFIFYWFVLLIDNLHLLAKMKSKTMLKKWRPFFLSLTPLLKSKLFRPPADFGNLHPLSHYGFLFHFCLKLHSPEYILFYKFSVLQKFDSSLVDNALLWQTQLVLLCHKLKGWNRSYMRQQQIIAGWFV